MTFGGLRKLVDELDAQGATDDAMVAVFPDRDNGDPVSRFYMGTQTDWVVTHGVYSGTLDDLVLLYFDLGQAPERVGWRPRLAAWFLALLVRWAR